MGMFSFLTSDTRECIVHVFSGLPVRTVYLLEPNGKAPHVCPAYRGTGNFGGYDAFEWLAERNAEALGLSIKDMNHEELRLLGLKLFDEGDCPFPLKLSFDPEAVYEDLPSALWCPNGGEGDLPDSTAILIPAHLDFRP